MRYRAGYLQQLLDQLQHRHDEVVRTIAPGRASGKDGVAINGLEVRLAVGSLNAVLAEIKKLK